LPRWAPKKARWFLEWPTSGTRGREEGRERERKSRRINGETQDGHAEKSRKKTKWEREGKWRG